MDRELNAPGRMPDRSTLMILALDSATELIASARIEAHTFDRDRLVEIADKCKQLAACSQHLAAVFLDHYEISKK